MAKVPQEVPVEKPIKAEARNKAAGINMAGRPLETTSATQTPVPRSEQMAPMLQAKRQHRYCHYHGLKPLDNGVHGLGNGNYAAEVVKDHHEDNGDGGSVNQSRGGVGIHNGFPETDFAVAAGNQHGTMVPTTRVMMGSIRSMGWLFSATSIWAKSSPGGEPMDSSYKMPFSRPGAHDGPWGRILDR
jgi:hypothetical protein